jgi:hypothetical protein
MAKKNTTYFLKITDDAGQSDEIQLGVTGINDVIEAAMEHINKTEKLNHDDENPMKSYREYRKALETTGEYENMGFYFRIFTKSLGVTMPNGAKDVSYLVAHQNDTPYSYYDFDSLDEAIEETLEGILWDITQWKDGVDGLPEYPERIKNNEIYTDEIKQVLLESGVYDIAFTDFEGEPYDDTWWLWEIKPWKPVLRNYAVELGAPDNNGEIGVWDTHYYDGVDLQILASTLAAKADYFEIRDNIPLDINAKHVWHVMVDNELKLLQEHTGFENLVYAIENDDKRTAYVFEV